jgi:hypothetical protein
MKSLQVLNTALSAAQNYSDLRVLRSAAGWYVGTIYCPDSKTEEPGSRDTGYFASKEEADYAFQTLLMLERFAINSKMQGTRKNQYIVDRFERIMVWLYGQEAHCTEYRLSP